MCTRGQLRVRARVQQHHDLEITRTNRATRVFYLSKCIAKTRLHACTHTRVRALDEHTWVYSRKGITKTGMQSSDRAQITHFVVAVHSIYERICQPGELLAVSSSRVELQLRTVCHARLDHCVSYFM